MGSHDQYGKKVLRAIAGVAFKDWGPSLKVDYGAGQSARLDGTVGDQIAVEIESRTSKQIRGAVLDLIFHPYAKKLLILLPVHMGNCEITADQCRHALSRFIKTEDFRVITLSGSGNHAMLEADSTKVKRALLELGFI
jgi:hypothetical protein